MLWSRYCFYKYILVCLHCISKFNITPDGGHNYIDKEVSKYGVSDCLSIHLILLCLLHLVLNFSYNVNNQGHHSYTIAIGIAHIFYTMSEVCLTTRKSVFQMKLCCLLFVPEIDQSRIAKCVDTQIRLACIPF